MDRSERARHKAIQDLARAARGPDASPQSLYAELCVALDAALDLQGVCWHITDPRTGIPVSSGGAGQPPGDFERSLEFEFARDDLLRFADLAQRERTVGVLSNEAEGRLANSPRWREMIEPGGAADEMRASFSDGFGIWGSLSLFGTRRFTAEEADTLAALVPLMTQGLRLAHARMPLPPTALDTTPTVVVLDGADRLVAADQRARSLMRAVAGEAPNGIPGSFFVLAAQARKRDPTRPAFARARDRDGHWVSIDASPLDDERQGGVALILQPASLESRLESLLRAFGLSEREREVAQLAVAGRSTKAIAAELYLSPWTVQDHLKSIFEKTSVSSRGALMALATREASGSNAPQSGPRAETGIVTAPE
jgi:DNA-binding CsgD family transcriptional regulator